MTINITTEELREFRNKCYDWYRGQVSHIFQNLPNTNKHDPFTTARHAREVIEKLSTEYETQNPFPKIFPSV